MGWWWWSFIRIKTCQVCKITIRTTNRLFLGKCIVRRCSLFVPAMWTDFLLFYCIVVFELCVVGIIQLVNPYFFFMVKIKRLGIPFCDSALICDFCQLMESEKRLPFRIFISILIISISLIIFCLNPLFRLVNW